MKRAVRSALFDPRTRRQLTFYAAIGVLAVTIDLGTFRGLMSVDCIPEIAVIVSGVASMLVHFFLNKYVNFRNHDRTMRDQLGTYCAVVSVWWVVTLTVVAVMTRMFLTPPMLAKLIAVALNFPLGFFAQRHLTFGPGIAATLRLRRRLKAL
jgi:putative flippase GtrA